MDDLIFHETEYILLDDYRDSIEQQIEIIHGKKNKQKHLNVDSSNNGSVFNECLWINKLFFFFSISFRSYSSFMHTKSRPPFQFLLNNVIQCKRLKLMLHTKSHHPNERISEHKKKQFIRSHTNQRVHLKMCKYKKQGVKIQLLHRVS